MSRRLHKTLRAVAVAVFMLTAPLLAPAHAGDGIAVSDPWIPLAPPAMKMHAGYFTLTNSGTEARHLVAVESPAYASAMLHVSRVDDGVATMEHLAQVTVPPGKSVTFAPGGLHLMLMGAKDRQSEGATVPLTLIFQNGERVTAEAVIMKRADRNGHDGHGTHQHKGM